MNTLSNKNILIFDLETTGFPEKKRGYTGRNEYYNYTDNDKYNNSRIVSIAWIFIKKYKNIIDDTQIIEYIRKPIDFSKIDNSNIHGITFEKAKKEGILLSNIMNNKGLRLAIQNCDKIIAHNCLFDLFILMNECYRLKFDNSLNKLNNLLDNNNYICTGELGRNICKIPIKFNKYFKYKMPKLSELYKYFYEKDPDNQHTAKGDVKTLLFIVDKIFN